MKEALQKEHETRRQKETLIISSIVAGVMVCICIILIVVYANSSSATGKDTDSVSTSGQESYEAVAIVPVLINPFDEVRIGARGAVVRDINSGEVLYSKNASTAYPIASITKIMTAVTAMETLDAEKLIQITWQDLMTEGSEDLVMGEYFTLKDMVAFMLVSSSNDGAVAIARSGGSVDGFVNDMNTTAKKIGMTNSTFRNPTGLDLNYETEAGATASAEDIALLLEYTLEKYPSLLEATHKRALSITSETGITHTVKNTNEIVARLPNAIGSKTGFTLVAGGNLAVVIDPGLNNPFAVVVLGSTKAGRFSDVAVLADATLDALILRNAVETLDIHVTEVVED
jgi:D-alanyl-D-alanine carboxypeptidase